jgi:hypothetical protein
MLEIHKSEKKDADKEKLHGLAYTRRWNVVDFMGKYHLSRFENKDICMLLDRADRARGPERWTNGFDDR